MLARFRLQGLHQPIVVVQPEDLTESLLLAAFIRFDANAFMVSVERLEDGRIKELTFIASQAE